MFSFANPWKIAANGGKTLRYLFGYDQRCEKMSSCAIQARELVKLIESDATLKANSAYKPQKIQDKFIAFLDECHRVDGGKTYHYLTVYKCNAMALLTVDEALRQVYDAMNSGYYESAKSEHVLRALEALYDYLNDNSLFCSTIKANARAAEMMELYKLQYVGRGMEYLKKRSELNL
jgi:hypothetical protein